MDPIEIHSLEEFKRISPALQNKQYVKFYCEQCGREVTRRKVRMLENIFPMLCRGCVAKIWVQNLNEEEKEQLIRKRRETTFQHFGVKNANQSPYIQALKRQHYLEKTGYAHYAKTPERKAYYQQLWRQKSIEEKQKAVETWKQTCLERYNVDNVSKLDSVKAKKRQTTINHFNVPCGFQVPGSYEKMKQTWARKTPEERRVIRQKACGKYIYGNQSFDSSWELAVWIWARDNNKIIVREPISFTYTFNNKTCHYFPDFEIDGQLVEVKGDHFFNKKDGTMQNPYNDDETKKYEAKHQCGLEHGVQFWLKPDIEPILQCIISTYGPNYLKSFRN